MKVVADFCLIPLTGEVSVSKYIAKCQEIIEKFPVKMNLHAYGTNLEGEWDQVLAAVKECHYILHAEGVMRISTSLKIGTRMDKDSTIEGKIQSVIEKKRTKA